MSFEPRLFDGDDLDSELLQPANDISENAALESSADDAYELPDDLLELAAQLTFDANYLTQRYPAPANAAAAVTGAAITSAVMNGAVMNGDLPAATEVAVPCAVRRYRPQFPLRAAMAFLISGVAIWTAAHAIRQRAALPVRRLVTTTVSNVSSQTLRAGDSETAVAALELDRRPAPSELEAAEHWTARESMLRFERLSGAEQEAVLDLMEHGPAAQEMWGI